MRAFWAMIVFFAIVEAQAETVKQAYIAGCSATVIKMLESKGIASPDFNKKMISEYCGYLEARNDSKKFWNADDIVKSPHYAGCNDAIVRIYRSESASKQTSMALGLCEPYIVENLKKSFVPSSH